MSYYMFFKFLLFFSFIIINVSSQDIDPDPDFTCRTSTDIIVVTDGSSSINYSGHLRLREWVLQLPYFFEMGPENVNIGLVAFSTRPYLIQPLTSNSTIFNNTVFHDLDWLCPRLNAPRCRNDIKCYYGNSHGCQTGIGIGMEMAYDMLLNSTRLHNEYTNQVIIVITDGRWNIGTPPTQVINTYNTIFNDINAKQVLRIFITVGPRINTPNIISYASPGPVNDTQRFIISSNSFEELNNTIPFMINRVCESGVVPPVIPPTITPPPPSPSPIVSDGLPLALLIGAPIGAVAALAAIPLLIRGKKLEKVEQEELIEPDVIESAVVIDPPPPLILPNMDTDAGAVGAPPAPPNRPLYAPASRAYVSASGKFSGNSTNKPPTFI